MCGCSSDTRSYQPAGTGVEPCEQISSETLALYQQLVQCLIEKAAYASASTNDNECAKANAILTDWRIEKEAGGSGCQYYTYWPILQDLIKRIILSGTCS